MVALYSEGLSIFDVGKRVGCHGVTVRRKLVSRGIEIRGTRHPARPIPPLKKWQASYIAAFIDGEGSIKFVRRRRKNGTTHVAVHLSATQVDVRPLLWIQNLVGGRVYAKKTRTGGINVWALTEIEQVKQVVKIIEPYLLVKGEKAREALILFDGDMPALRRKYG